MQQPIRRGVLTTALATLLLTACGGAPSLTEYAASLDALAFELGTQLAAGDTRMSTGTPSVQDAREVLVGALAARKAFQEGLTALDPPDEIADLHIDLVEVHARIIEAQEVFAGRAEGAVSLDQLDQSEEARAYRTMVEESVSVCEEFLARIDATGDREIFVEMPWVPGDLKEVVEVTFGC